MRVQCVCRTGYALHVHLSSWAMYACSVWWVRRACVRVCKGKAFGISCTDAVSQEDDSDYCKCIPVMLILLQALFETAALPGM